MHGSPGTVRRYLDRMWAGCPHPAGTAKAGSSSSGAREPRLHLTLGPSASRAELVGGDAEGVGGGGFAAQDERAERDREEAAADGEVDLFGGEIAFGADQPEDFPDGPVERGGGFGEVSFQRLRAGVQTGDEFEVVSAGRGEEGGEGFHGRDFGEPRVAALFGGFEGGGAPLFELLFLPFAVEVDLGALAGDRDDAAGADLGGFAHDAVHAGAFGEGLRERDFVGQGSGAADALDGEHGGGIRIAGEDADPLGAASIEGDHQGTAAGAVDDDEVVGFVCGEAQGGGIKFGREAVNAEVGHGVRAASEEADEQHCPPRKNSKGAEPWKASALADLRNYKLCLPTITYDGE